MFVVLVLPVEDALTLAACVSAKAKMLPSVPLPAAVVCEEPFAVVALEHHIGGAATPGCPLVTSRGTFGFAFVTPWVRQCLVICLTSAVLAKCWVRALIPWVV